MELGLSCHFYMISRDQTQVFRLAQQESLPNESFCWLYSFFFSFIPFIINVFVYDVSVYVHVFVCLVSTYIMEIRGQLLGVGFSFWDSG